MEFVRKYYQKFYANILRYKAVLTDYKNEQKKEKAIGGFNSLASHYDNSFYGKFTIALEEQILQELTDIRFKFHNLLDIGCGTGRLLEQIEKKNLQLVQQQKIKLWGIDISKEMTKIARKKFLYPKNIHTGDAEKLIWQDNSFDVVISSGVFHHFTNPLKNLQEVHRVLIPKATFILADWWLPPFIRETNNAFIWMYGEGDVKVYSLKEMQAMLLQTGFSVLKKRTIKRSGQIFVAVKN